MSITHVICGEQCIERDLFVCRHFSKDALDRIAATLLTVDEAEHTCHNHASISDSFDSRDAGSARGTDVIDDDHLRAFFEKTLNAPASTVGFF